MEAIKTIHTSPPRTVKKFTVSEVQKFWKEIVSHKYLFLISVVAFLAAAYLINNSSTPFYMVESSLIIKETENPTGGPGSLLLAGEKQMAPGVPINRLEEMAIITSQPFIHKTLLGLDMQVSYYEEGRFRSKEISGKQPFTIQFPDTSLLKHLYNKRYEVKFTDNQRFLIYQEGKKDSVGTELAVNSVFNLDKVPVKVVTAANFDAAVHGGKVYEFTVHDLNLLAFDIKGSLSAYTASEESPVIKLNFKTPNPEKGILFLNALTKQYIVNKYEEKSRSAAQALSFINDQINSVKGTLGSAESNLASFRASNTYTDAQEMASRNLSVISQLDEERANLSLNDRYYSKVLADLERNTDVDQLMAPSTVGINDNLTENFIKQLAELQLEKNSYLANGGGTKNPLVQEIDVKLRNVKSSLRDNIRSLAAANRTKLGQINSRASQFQSKVYNIPLAEKRFTEIKRNTDFNDALYQFLMQKRVEAGIAKASATVEDKIVEPAFLSSSVPVSPKTTNNYALAFLLGFAFPLGVIRVKRSLNKKLESKDELQRMTSIPVLGTIYHNLENASFVVDASTRSAVSESFRILRSNITSFTKDRNKKVFLITSSDSGEGKSFVSINVASSFALAKMKTILINLDMRVPSTAYQELGEYELGISSFLQNKATLQEIIHKTHNPSLDYISTGELPDNPSELLMDSRLELLLDYLRAHYDYIIIDTPPIGPVADSYVISEFSDLNLLIVREKYTSKERISELESIHNDGEMSNLCIVINDVRLSKRGYKSAYYYNKKKTSGY